MNIQKHLRTQAACSALCVGLMWGCDDGANPLAEDPSPETQLAEGQGQALGQKPLTVMSRNVYLGADIAPVLGAGFDNLEVLAAVTAGVWAEVQGNDFRERAVALVDEIEATRPDVIGVQELARFLTLELDFTDGSYGITGVLDFQTILEEELKARRLPYAFAGVQENSTVRAPIAGLGHHPNFIPTHLVQLTIRDGILVRRGLNVREVSQGNYQAEVPLGEDPFGNPLTLKRGWVRLGMKVNGIPYHFVSTHMEIQPFYPIQEAQAQELLNEVVADLSGVTVLMGDFNSNAEGSNFGDPGWTPTYDVVMAAGFDDVWTLAYPGMEGLTCCHASDLSNPAPTFDQRIDFVFLRASDLKGPRDIFPGFVDAEIVGDDPDLRTTPNGLWPSDHAGVVAFLGLDRGRFKNLR